MRFSAQQPALFAFLRAVIAEIFQFQGDDAVEAGLVEATADERPVDIAFSGNAVAPVTVAKGRGGGNVVPMLP